MIYVGFRTWESILHSSVSPCSGHMAPRLIRQPCAEELQIILAPGRFRPLLWYYANVKPQKLWQRLQSSKTPQNAPPASLIATLKLMPLLSTFPLLPKFAFPSDTLAPKPPALLPPSAWSRTLGCVQFLGVAAVGWCEVSGGRGGGGAIGGGVGESLQTLGASPSPCQTRVTAGFC